jgi:hypothetical protein
MRDAIIWMTGWERSLTCIPSAAAATSCDLRALDTFDHALNSLLSDRTSTRYGAGQHFQCRAVDFLARRSSYCDESGSDEEVAMKYVMLIYQGDAQERQAALSEEEQKQVYADYQGINETPGVTPVPPMGLAENATTVRVEGGRILTTDGPFVGMKEAVGGLFILEADDLDAAIEVAARVPAARYGGAVEIRPSEVYW